jgi:hypothetical protein
MKEERMLKAKKIVLANGRSGLVRALFLFPSGVLERHKFFILGS